MQVLECMMTKVLLGEKGGSCIGCKIMRLESTGRTLGPLSLTKQDSGEGTAGAGGCSAEGMKAEQGTPWQGPITMAWSVLQV